MANRFTPPEKLLSPRARRSLVKPIRWSPEEWERIEAAARGAGEAPQNLVRRGALAAAAAAVVALGAVLAVALAGCGAEPLPGDDVAAVAPVTPPAPAEVVAPQPSIVGYWVSETTGEVEDLQDGGAYHHIGAEGSQADGTWSVVDGYLTTVAGGTGRQRIDGLTADRLTLAPGGVYDRSTAPAPNRCDIPAGDAVIVTSCPGVCKVCVAQNYDYRYVPPADAPGVHQINLAGCSIPTRPDIICVTDCAAPCPSN